MKVKNINKNTLIEEIKIRYGQTQEQATRTYEEAIHEINKNEVIGSPQVMLYKTLFSSDFNINLSTKVLRSGRKRFVFDFSKFPSVNQQKADIATRLQNLADTDIEIFESVVNFLDNKISYSQLKRFIKKRKHSSDFIRRHAPGSY